jgi:hypothetical protein
MPKTFDEKRVDFDRMLEGRLPKAVKAVELLANLARKSDYAWTPSVLQTMLDQLDDAVDMVAKAFGASEGPAPAPSTGETQAAPVGEVPRAASPVIIDQRAEVRWAHDALRRGNTELAEARLKLVIKAWIEEERP